MLGRAGVNKTPTYFSSVTRENLGTKLFMNLTGMVNTEFIFQHTTDILNKMLVRLLTVYASEKIPVDSKNGTVVSGKICISIFSNLGWYWFY